MKIEMFRVTEQFVKGLNLSSCQCDFKTKLFPLCLTVSHRADAVSAKRKREEGEKVMEPGLARTLIMLVGLKQGKNKLDVGAGRETPLRKKVFSWIYL